METMDWAVIELAKRTRELHMYYNMYAYMQSPHCFSFKHEYTQNSNQNIIEYECWTSAPMYIYLCTPPSSGTHNRAPTKKVHLEIVNSNYVNVNVAQTLCRAVSPYIQWVSSSHSHYYTPSIKLSRARRSLCATIQIIRSLLNISIHAHRHTEAYIHDT